MKATIEEVIKTYKNVKSIRKTAKLTGYSKSGVGYLLKSHNVEMFPRIRCGAESSSRKFIESLDDENPRKLVRNYDYMFNLYVTQKMSLPEISRLLKVDEKTVLTGLKQCGIKRRTIKEALLGQSRPSAQGSNNHNWKGGLSGWRKLARGRLNEHFVYPIMKRDGFRCQWCLSIKNLVVHHHKRSFMDIVNGVRNMCDENDLENFVALIVKEHRLDDGITLCKKCHDSFHKKRK